MYNYYKNICNNYVRRHPNNNESKVMGSFELANKIQGKNLINIFNLLNLYNLKIIVINAYNAKNKNGLPFFV